MRRTLSMITLAVLTVGLLGSCSKINERIDNLEKKVDGLENEKIASIQTQVDNIGNSISDLGAIRSNIQSLTDGAKAQGQDIAALQAADKALGSRIEELSKYVGDTLKAYATEEWVKATFSTLEQYKKTCDTIAKIDARIGALDENLSKKIADCADSLTTWINGQFEGYYTAAQMDAKLALMKSAVDSAKAAGEITDAKADSLAVELTKVQPAIDSAKAQLTREYTAAIDTAIKTCEGKLTKQIQDEIEKVNEAVAALAQRVGILEFQVRDLLGRVGALEGMIQSVTILPAYSDGSVKVENDSLHIDCIITPASATRWLGIRNFTILVKGVAGTKAGVETIRIASPWDLKIDWTRGTASIKVKIADKLPGNDSTLAVAINVKDTRNGSDYTTEFVPVYVAGPALPAGALPGVFSIGKGTDGQAGTADDVKVYFSKGNLYYDGSAFKFETNQYDYQSVWSASHISHFYWSSNADVACDETYNGGSTSASDIFFTNATGFTVNVGGEEQTGWRTLTDPEWDFLIGRSSIASPIRYGKWRGGVSVCDTANCYVFLPDNWKWGQNGVGDGWQAGGYPETSTPDCPVTWQVMEAAGAVCFPATGIRDEGQVNDSGRDGYYWTSSALAEEDGGPIRFHSYSDGGGIDFGDYTGHPGCSVRLVTDVK